MTTTLSPPTAPAGNNPTKPRIVLALARRSLMRVLRVPAAIVPTVAMPVFLLIAFSGSFSAVTDLPGFPTDNILNWVAPYAVIQGAAFAGAGASQAVAADVENGFYDRLLMSPASRLGLLLGPVTASMVRVIPPLTIVTLVALLGGARFDGGPAGVLVLVLAAVGVAVVATLWGLSMVYKIRTQQAGTLISMGVFVAMFLSIGQVPLAVMQGWLHGVARVNPMTNVIRLARQGLLGDVTWAQSWPGLVVILVVGLGFGLLAARGLRKMSD